MNKLEFYVDLDVRYGAGKELQDKDDQEFLLSRILQGIHAAIVQECGDTAHRQNKIAISFPLSNGKVHGGVIRVFSPESDVLKRMVRHSKIHRYTSDLNVLILPVPKDCKFCSFSRNRKNDQLSHSALRRAELRRVKFGFKPILGMRREDGFTIDIKSESNGNNIPLTIEMNKKDEEFIGFFNSYGLSKDVSTPLF